MPVYTHLHCLLLFKYKLLKTTEASCPFFSKQNYIFMTRLEKFKPLVVSATVRAEKLENIKRGEKRLFWFFKHEKCRIVPDLSFNTLLVKT